jgi:hypothetical protein
MKFELTISDSRESSKAIKTIKGFEVLADACAAALAIAQRRSREPRTLVSVWVTAAGRHSLEILNTAFAERCGFEKLNQFLLEAEIAQVKVIGKRKAEAARWKFLKAHGAVKTLETIHSNSVAADAFARNDFATVEKFLAGHPAGIS